MKSTEPLPTDPPVLQPQTEVLGLSGSPRINGNSDILLEAVLAGVGLEDVASARINLTTLQFKGCIGCEKCRKDKICTALNDGMSPVYARIISSKGLVLVSPTHNYNVTSWMKAFLDRLYCFYNFEDSHPRGWSSQLSQQGRKAVVAAICEQESAYDMGFTVEAMKRPLVALGYDIVGELSVFDIFEKGGIKDNEDALRRACELGRELARAIK